MKTKRLFSVLILVVLLPLMAWADVWQDPETKVNYEYLIGRSEAAVIYSPDVTGEIDLLSCFTMEEVEYTVTYISIGAFANCLGLTKVTIPESVTIIGSDAFYGCIYLSEVSIPASVTSIGYSAFANCQSLTGIILPEGVSIGRQAFWNTGLYSVAIPSGVKNIGAGAFQQCYRLFDVTISEGVTNIEEGAFMDCSSLTDIRIPSSVSNIGRYAFYRTGWYNSQPEGVLYLDNWLLGIKGDYRNSMIGIDIIEGTIGIGGGVFADCRGLTGVTIPSSVKYISEYAFQNCFGLTVFTIPGSVTNIATGAFSGCKSLTHVTISEGVTNIGDFAFENCSSLSSITIPESIVSIGNGVFRWCTSLNNVIIRSSASSIGSALFQSCNNLNEIDFHCSTIGRWLEGSVYDSIQEIVIGEEVTRITNGRYVFARTGWFGNQPDGLLYLCNWLLGYKGDSPTGKLVIKEGTKHISDDSFATYCRDLTSVTIPSSVTSIGEYAFYACTGLTSVTIPEGVTIIGNYAFSGCTGLTSVTIPTSVTSIGEYAFYYCTGLTSVTSLIQEPFTISYYVFSSSYNIATLYVPKGTKEKYEATPYWNQFQTIVELDEVPTAVDDAIAYGSEPTVTERYALGGQHVSVQQQGLNIVRMSDGTVKKVVMK